MYHPHELLAFRRFSFPEKRAGFFQAGANMLRSAATRMGAGVTRFMENRAMNAGRGAAKAVGGAPSIPKVNFADLPPARNAGQQAGRTAAGATPAATQTGVGKPPTTPGTPRQNSFGHVAWNAVRGGLGFGAQEGATRLGRGAAHAGAATMIGAPIAASMMGNGGSANNPYQQSLGMQVTAEEQGVYTVKTAISADLIRKVVNRAERNSKIPSNRMHQFINNNARAAQAVTGTAAAKRNAAVSAGVAAMKARSANGGRPSNHTGLKALGAAGLLGGTAAIGYAASAKEKGAEYKVALDPQKVRAGVDLASYGALAAPLVAKIVAPQFYNKHEHAMHALDGLGLAGLSATELYGLAKGESRTPALLNLGGLAAMGVALHQNSNH